MKNPKIFLSAGVLMLAVAGAFATNAAKSTKSGSVPGYVKNGSACSYVTECNNIGGIMCADPDSGAQLWGLAGGGCPTALFHRQ